MMTDFLRAEQARLRRHFDATLAALAPRGRGLRSPAQRRRREHLLGALFAYSERGRFPKNDWGGARAPVLVDSAETRCAMAHLIEVSGHGDLVQRVAAIRNHAFVRELAGDEELGEWLRAHGLTLAEAARIQPTYDAAWNYQHFCSGAPYGVLIYAEIVDATSARVLSVHGERSDVKVGQVVRMDRRREGAPAPERGGPDGGRVPVGELRVLGRSLHTGEEEGELVWPSTGHVVRDGFVEKGNRVPFVTAVRMLQSPSCAMDMAKLYSPEKFRDGVEVPQHLPAPLDGAAAPPTTSGGAGSTAPGSDASPAAGCWCRASAGVDTEPGQLLTASLLVVAASRRAFRRASPRRAPGRGDPSG